jgi:hypothetical protein
MIGNKNVVIRRLAAAQWSRVFNFDLFITFGPGSPQKKSQYSRRPAAAMPDG